MAVATQRMTIAKLGGAAGKVVLDRINSWSAARRDDDSNEWSPEQWPIDLRNEADDFAERVRAHSLDLTVCHFVEWIDRWSMGDLFSGWLTPAGRSVPMGIHANRFEIYGYPLPDGGKLSHALASAEPQQFDEADWWIASLRHAVNAWEKLIPSATLLVLRQVVDGTALDEEIASSLQSCPAWLV